jgi:tripartite-type tricarboxylate transporter receptor subunit TctC
VVPYPAGGNVARIIGNRLQEVLGQPFIVDNKAGAGGLIAGEAFAKSARNWVRLQLATVSRQR